MNSILPERYLARAVDIRSDAKTHTLTHLYDPETPCYISHDARTHMQMRRSVLPTTCLYSTPLSASRHFSSPPRLLYRRTIGLSNILLHIIGNLHCTIKVQVIPGSESKSCISIENSLDLCCHFDVLFVMDPADVGAYPLEAQKWQGILLQEVPAYVDESARPTVVGEFSNEGFGLLNEALDGC